MSALHQVPFHEYKEIRPGAFSTMPLAKVAKPLACGSLRKSVWQDYNPFRAYRLSSVRGYHTYMDEVVKPSHNEVNISVLYRSMYIYTSRPVCQYLYWTFIVHNLVIPRGWLTYTDNTVYRSVFPTYNLPKVFQSLLFDQGYLQNVRADMGEK